MLGGKGFVRTLEVVISVLIVFSLFSFLSTRVYQPSFDLEVDLTSFQSTALNGLSDELRRDLLACDLSRVQYLLSFVKPSQASSKTVFEWLVELKGGLSNGNYSFVYNFPRGVDKGSVSIGTFNYDFPTSVDWNWFELPIIIQNNDVNRVNYDAGFNVFVPVKNVLRDSFVFYWKGEELLFDLKGFTNESNGVGVNFSVRFPQINKFESGTAYLVFAVNNSYYSQEYANLSYDSGLSYEVQNVRESPRGEVLFSVPLVVNDSLVLKFKIGSNEAVEYANISGVVDSGLSTKWNDYKDCSGLVLEQEPPGSFSVFKKTFYYDKLTINLESWMWLPWEG